MRPPVEEPAPREEPPPFLGRWGRLYAAVLLYLASLIALFYLFGRLFTP